jgi:hypothetical protein
MLKREEKRVESIINLLRSSLGEVYRDLIITSPQTYIMLLQSTIISTIGELEKLKKGGD